MKKLYTLLFMTFAFAGNAQNLVTNGNLETWTDPNTPTNFTMLAGTTVITAGVTQETTTIHGGTSSAKHTTPATSSVKIQNETAILVPGTSYTVSYWFLDNDPNAKSRPWIYFLDAANATLTDTTTDSAFRPSAYSTDDANWIQFSTTFVAPANAVKLRFEMRSYAVGTTGLGSIYYDDMSVTQNLAVNQNTILGLNIFANNKNLYITSDSSADKNVTVYDILGKEVVNAIVSNLPINVSSLSAGTYIVKVTEEGKTATRKLVIE